VAFHRHLSIDRIQRRVEQKDDPGGSLRHAAQRRQNLACMKTDAAAPKIAVLQAPGIEHVDRRAVDRYAEDRRALARIPRAPSGEMQRKLKLQQRTTFRRREGVTEQVVIGMPMEVAKRRRDGCAL
jgi:hypothetical protein